MLEKISRSLLCLLEEHMGNPVWQARRYATCTRTIIYIIATDGCMDVTTTCPPFAVDSKPGVQMKCSASPQPGGPAPFSPKGAVEAKGQPK